MFTLDGELLCSGILPGKRPNPGANSATGRGKPQRRLTADGSQEDAINRISSSQEMDRSDGQFVGRTGRNEVGLINFKNN